MQILVVHIGPVQEFIESARKCRDLWFGSWLLSELARAAAGAIVKIEGSPEEQVLVFPGAKLSETGRAVANKIVARIHKDPGEVVRAAETAMRERLRQIRDAAFRLVGRKDPRRSEFFHEEIAKRQVDGLIEFLWASAPQGEKGYIPALREAERVLSAVKNAKQWEQPTWAKDGVPKSSLDGIRESVLDERLFPNPKNGVPSRNLSEERLRWTYGVHRAERLCGVGLLKRFGSTDQRDDEKPQRIFSTSHVASGPFRAGMNQNRAQLQSAWETFLSELCQIDSDLLAELEEVPRRDPMTGYIDGSIFYEGRLIETLEELGFDERNGDQEHFEQARKVLRCFLKKAHQCGLREPIPYYALLLADGDRMGKVISETRAFEEHRRLSDALESFASSTRGIVTKHDGALVYAGGDDVLALLPLHTLLACAAELAATFKEKMSEWTVEEDGQQKSPTLSMGIAIVHHLMPLDEALALVRKTEKVAKKIKGKDALAIVVKKRGGEPTEVSGHWNELDARLNELIELHQAEAISVKTQYELMDLDLRAGAPELEKVRKAEVARILARKQPKKGRETMTRDTLQKLEAQGIFTDPARLGRELYVAHLLAQAIDQSEARPREEPLSLTPLPEVL
ncbi:MAG: type III-B CRISPR-associated protein Cas10/Cmr2 [Myxococcales bacterium]|nr:type III-B CRISPR-associated protein Cas10/Cmr2 [Polyangiaceae bacterium]MDW8250185.1 type III-B CRISPR-associated protein Cas10/Cmr2 [Myxococcales bacterium]